MASAREIRSLMAQAKGLLGVPRVVLRCDTDELETVYVEDRNGRMVVHDGGETWYRIHEGSEDTRPWDDKAVAPWCSERGVDVAREMHEGEVVHVRLELTVHGDDEITEAVAVLGDLLDLVNSEHDLSGGWRD